MDPPYRFPHLSIETLWPYEERAYSILATLAQPLSPLMVLDICVRRLRLFRDCAVSHIRDVRVEETDQTQRDFPCQNRERLISEIAIALEVYDYLMARQGSREQTHLEERLRLLAELRGEGQAFQRWFKRGGRWNARIARSDRLSERAFTDALDKVERFCRGWSKYIFPLPGYQRGARQGTIRALYESFVAHGPSRRTRPVYTDQALYAAIYSIFEAFGMESQGDMANGSRRIAYEIRIIREKAASNT